MPSEPPPKGVHPLFLRGVTLEKFGMKTGENVNDVVDYKLVPKEEIVREIQVMGVMSDFEPAKKHIESYPGTEILIVVDRLQKYDETFLLIYTEEAKKEMMEQMMEEQEALNAQLAEQLKADEERKAAELAKQSVVYVDKPLTPRRWMPQPASGAQQVDTEAEIAVLNPTPVREVISVEISRPKRSLRQTCRFSDRNAEIGGVAEFRAYKDPNFRSIRESDLGIQVAPACKESSAQTTFYRQVNKAVQYEPAGMSKTTSSGAGSSSSAAKTTTTTSTSTSTGTSTGTGVDHSEMINDNLLVFLEKATVRIEQALQQNESVDIFHETFRLLRDDEGQEGAQTDNELREFKNFADANYSKSKALPAIDWMPKTQGMVAVSAVRNISFDQRVPILGQTHTSYVMLWDFRLLVKPLILMQSHHEIFTFRFNRTDPHLVVGGCLTGQVVLWEIADAVNNALRKNNRGGGGGGAGNTSGGGSGNNNAAEEDEEQTLAPVVPKYVSGVDYSHKRCVADLFWLPPSTQINYRGQLVGKEHLDGHSYQFVTVAGDGLVMVWDIRYEKIFNDELRHVARPKHIPTEKTSNKDANGQKPIWAPIFRAHLKRLEGVGELSLCKICETANPKNSTLTVGKPSNFPGDSRSQFIIATEEGDIIFTDLSTRKETTVASNKEKEEDDEEETEVSCLKWITRDHARPSVHLQESPFFPQIVLSVSDWNFHIWKLGEDQPLFVSPLSSSYLTAGAWSITRPAVLFVACADGQIMVWDFTDSGFHPSIELKATHAKITSLEILAGSNPGAAPGGGTAANVPNTRHQLMAVGDDVGTLHIFEVPRNLVKPVHREEMIMLKFLERELQRIELNKSDADADVPLVGIEEYKKSHPAGTSRVNTASGEDGFMLSPPPTASVSTKVPGLGATGNGATAATEIQLTPQELALRAEEEKRQKEEDEFLKLESIFLSELGIDLSELPQLSVVPK